MNPTVKEDPARRDARPIGRRTLLAGIPALGAASLAWALAAPAARAEPNAFERREIGDEALEAFRRMITLWREELYFELYEEGWQTSKSRVSLEDFAQRMVKLSWVPEGGPDEKFLRADFRHRTMVYVETRLTFQHKFDPTRSFTKPYATLLLLENGRWRIDLVQLLRSPYA